MMSFAFNVRNHAQRCDKKFTWLNDHIFHLQTVRWPKGSSFYLLRSRNVFPRYKEQRTKFSATIYFQSTRRRLSFLLLRDTLIFTQKSHTPRVFFSRLSARNFIATRGGVGCLATNTPETRPSSIEAILYNEKGSRSWRRVENVSLAFSTSWPITKPTLAQRAWLV